VELTPKMLGTGLLRMAAEDQKLYPVWQMEMVDAQTMGQPVLSFPEWKKLKQKMQQVGQTKVL
jgi:hypothetical protein